MSDDSLLLNGYCYELAPEWNILGWSRTPNDCWETRMISRRRAVAKLGERHIDGAPCMVFRCDDNKIRAVVMSALDTSRGLQ